jgi:topoisomerase IA-like protein
MAPKAFRQRTLPASSLCNWGALQLEGTATQEIRTSFYDANVVKEDDVQVMAEGQTVKHETYGLGIVTASDQERTAIDFDDHGPKLFVTSIMVAELIGEAPATPPKTKRRRKASTAAKAAKKAAAATAAATAAAGRS